MTAARQAMGRAGEERAERWYRDHGYEILDRNWRCRAGELDLVVRSPTSHIVFCEVKARSSDRYGTPFEAVTPVKAARIRRLAAAWLADHRDTVGFASELRFDVAAVRGFAIEVREGIF